MDEHDVWMLTGSLVVAIASNVQGRSSARRDEKRNQKCSLVREKAAELKNAIEGLSNDARRYYTSPIDDYQRTVAAALINAGLPRISRMVSRYAMLVGQDRIFFSQVYGFYHSAVTSDPFGRPDFEPLSFDERRMQLIQQMELQLVEKIESSEDAANGV